MDDNTRERQHKRDQLVDDLTQSIIDSARPLIDPKISTDELNKASAEINERLRFEANVAFSEVVTRFGVRKARVIVDATERTFLRFGKNFRAQHMLMFVSVIFLIITGIPLKFPSFGISKFIIINIFGGLQSSTLVHRIAATGLIIVGGWHLVYIVASRMGRRDFFLMIPRPRDAVDAFQTIMYYLGRKTSGPKFGRFSFIEKFDYWAVYWGMVVMIGSGLILWFKENFAKDIFDIAREAHSDEGLLATLAIIVWHFYNVHFNPEVFPMSWVWWRGTLTESEMKHHHPLEYAEIINAERETLVREQTDNESERKAGS